MISAKWLCLAVVTIIGIEGKSIGKAERHQIALSCIDEVGINKKVVEKANKGDFPSSDNPNYPKYKEFLTCSYKKQQYQYKNGTINMDSIKAFLDKYYNQQDLVILDGCNTQSSPDHGENAYRAMNCIIGSILNLPEKDTNEVE